MCPHQDTSNWKLEPFKVHGDSEANQEEETSSIRQEISGVSCWPHSGAGAAAVSHSTAKKKDW